MNVIFNSFEPIIDQGILPWLKELSAPEGPKRLLRGMKDGWGEKEAQGVKEVWGMKEGRGMMEARCDVQPLYVVEFPESVAKKSVAAKGAGSKNVASKNVAPKRAYLAKFIEHEGRRFLNALQEEMDAAFNECEKRFFAHEALNVLEQNLERTALLISDHRPDVAFIGDVRLQHCLVASQPVLFGPAFSPSSSSSSSSAAAYFSSVVKDTSVQDEAYVLGLLKRQLICLYLEVQERFKGYLERNVLTLEDIHWVFFREAVPEHPGVVSKDQADEEGRVVDEPVVPYGAVEREAMSRDGVACDAAAPDCVTGDCVTGDSVTGDGVTGDEVTGNGVACKGVAQEAKRFEPVKEDTRPGRKGVLAYGDIVANQARFAQLERALFEYGLIDADYRFKRKPHGNVMKMAAVYWVAFKKGYFQKYYFKEKRRTAVTANDVRLFLNHRYQTNIERQFQNFRDEEVLNKYLEREVWIELVGVHEFTSLQVHELGEKG